MSSDEPIAGPRPLLPSGGIDPKGGEAPPGTPPIDPAQVIRAFDALVPLNRAMGLKLVEVGQGRATMHLPWSDQFLGDPPEVSPAPVSAATAPGEAVLSVGAPAREPGLSAGTAPPGESGRAFGASPAEPGPAAPPGETGASCRAAAAEPGLAAPPGESGASFGASAAEPTPARWRGLVHGGVLSILLDATCGVAAFVGLWDAEPKGSGPGGPGSGPGGLRIIATLDLRIDHLRPAEVGRELIASAQVVRTGRQVLFVRGIAHHGDESAPVAAATATFAVKA